MVFYNHNVHIHNLRENESNIILVLVRPTIESMIYCGQTVPGLAVYNLRNIYWDIAGKPYLLKGAKSEFVLYLECR